MVEELYIYDKDGVRQSVDLNSPSGITLKWVSNLFNSLDKVNCSYSYTFKIPITRHNREVFDNLDDIRHISGMLGRKVKAEFIQNGIPMFSNGNLYVDKAASDGYSCVFTWGVVEGLQKLKDVGCSLNELRDALTKAGYESKELTDDMLEWSEVVSNSSIMTQFDNTAKVLRPYYGIYPSDPNYGEHSVYDSVYSQGVPKPVMPVMYLIDSINKAFGTTFSFGEKRNGMDSLPSEPISKWLMKDLNIITYGVLPLTGIELTDKQISSLSKELTYERVRGGSNRILGTELIFCFKKDFPSSLPMMKQEVNYIAYKGYDDAGKEISWDFPSSETELQNYSAKSIAEWNSSSFLCVGITAISSAPIKMTGKFYITISRADDENKISQSLYDNMKFKVYSWKVVNKGYSDEHIEKIEVTSYEATDTEEVMDSDNVVRWRFHYNFMEEEGYNAASFQNEDAYSTGKDYAEYWFGFDSVIRIRSLTMEKEFTFAPKINDITEEVHLIDTFTNLPDIDCLSFMKSLFYMVGGFPFVNTKGEIVIGRYETIKENLGKLNVVDWSKKVTSLLPSYTEMSLHLSDFKQNNYYMNKWDDLDRTGSDLKEEDDVYEDGIGDIICQDETLDKEQTVQQIPFYPPYLLNRKFPATTDGTIKSRDFDISGNNFSINDRGEVVNSNKWKYVESKPAYGYVHRIPFFDNTKTDRIKDWAENYGVNYVRMSVLNPFKDIMMNPSYRYLQEIVRSPFMITENLLLNEFDLMDLDYTKPIYLEKYNSYFAVVSIQRESSGVCKCELVKLPAYKPPIVVTLSINTQDSIYINIMLELSRTDDRNINVGLILKNEQKGRYVKHINVSLQKNNIISIFKPIRGTEEWEIYDVWLDHYEEGDYNDYEFKIGG